VRKKRRERERERERETVTRVLGDATFFVLVIVKLGFLIWISLLWNSLLHPCFPLALGYGIKYEDTLKHYGTTTIGTHDVFK